MPAGVDRSLRVMMPGVKPGVPVRLPFLNGAIDNFRISGVERDFAIAF